MTREDAIKTLKELWRETNDHWYEEVYSMAIKALEAVPSADRPSKVVVQVTFDEEKLHEIVKEAVERFEEEYEIADRPSGEWLKFGLGRGTRILFCTNCERRIEVPLSQGDSNYDFCPNCGARMKGADDEPEDEPQTIVIVKDHGRKQALEMIDLYYKLKTEQTEREGE